MCNKKLLSSNKAACAVFFDKGLEKSGYAVLIDDISIEFIFLNTCNSYGIVARLGVDSYNLSIVWFIK